MEGYELTDRGKIVLTVILVILLFFLPAAIFMFSAIGDTNSKVPDDQDAQTSVTSPSATPPPEIIETPPPNGGGFGPPEGAGQNVDGGQDGQSPTDGQDPTDGQEPPEGQGPTQPPKSGQGSVNPTEGTLSFLFFPDTQDSLDDETSSMLDEFLGSPKNTIDSIVAVETPRLSYGVSVRFMAVIVEAMDSRGVEENRIAYITSPGVPLDDGSFSVNFSYISRRQK